MKSSIPTSPSYCSKFLDPNRFRSRQVNLMENGPLQIPQRLPPRFHRILCGSSPLRARFVTHYERALTDAKSGLLARKGGLVNLLQTPDLPDWSCGFAHKMAVNSCAEPNQRRFASMGFPSLFTAELSFARGYSFVFFIKNVFLSLSK